MALLALLRDHDAPYDHNTYGEAAGGGHLEILQWLAKGADACGAPRHSGSQVPGGGAGEGCPGETLSTYEQDRVQARLMITHEVTAEFLQHTKTILDGPKHHYMCQQFVGMVKEQAAKHTSNHIFLTLCESQMVVAGMVCRVMPAERTIMIDLIVVNTPGKGHGSSLLRCLEAFAQAKQLHTLQAICVPSSAPFFTQNGFVGPDQNMHHMKLLVHGQI